MSQTDVGKANEFGHSVDVEKALDLLRQAINLLQLQNDDVSTMTTRDVKYATRFKEFLTSFQAKDTLDVVKLCAHPESPWTAQVIYERLITVLREDIMRKHGSCGEENKLKAVSDITIWHVKEELGALCALQHRWNSGHMFAHVKFEQLIFNHATTVFTHVSKQQAPEFTLQQLHDIMTFFNFMANTSIDHDTFIVDGRTDLYRLFPCNYILCKICQLLGFKNYLRFIVPPHGWTIDIHVMDFSMKRIFDRRCWSWYPTPANTNDC